MGWAELIQTYNGSDAVKHFRCLLYGYPGCGKTTLAATFPKPFFIDTDRGMRSLSGSYPYVRLLGQQQPFTFVMQLLRDALGGTGPFAAGQPLAAVETIVLDGITALADDYLLSEAMVEGSRNLLKDKANFDDYGKLKQRLIAIGNILKDVSDRYNVVVTALADEDKNDVTGELVGMPLMTGKYREKIGADFDEEYYVYTVQAATGLKYMLNAQPYRWYEAKSRLTTIGTLEAPTYEKIIQLRKKNA